MSVQRQGAGHIKRQYAYLAGTGQATDSCANAVVYNLVNGQLFSNSSAGSQQFGTDLGIQYANFTPSSTPGSLTTVFSVDSQNNLLWSNANFYNSQARFCVMRDGTLVAVFDNPLLAPEGCAFVLLSLTRVSTCAAAVGAPALSGPSGPVGVRIMIISPSLQRMLTDSSPQECKVVKEWRASQACPASPELLALLALQAHR